MPRLTVAWVASFALSGCASLQSSENVLGVITPYRIEIVQGNVLTKEQVALVRPGMSRAQVRDVLGSPLLADIFHADRWDYVFTIRRQGAEPQRRSVVARFEGEVLKAIEAEELPSEREFVATITTTRPGSIPKLELSEDERRSLPAPAKPRSAPETVEPAGATRAYPPLEPRS
jgi:outer membrane protein assembly factor BamE